MKHFFTAFIFSLLFVLPLAAKAQGTISVFENRMQALNQTQLTFSPRYKTQDEMFAMRVINSTRQLVGRVQDLRLDESGKIAALVSEINNVDRNERMVETPGYEVTFREDISSFEIPLGLSDNDVVSAGALAAIEPAAGGGSVYSLRALLGADVRSNSGKRVGLVEHVIFDDQGGSIVALVLEDVPGTSRYNEIAVPFDPQLISMNSDYGRVEVRLDNSTAKKITDYARRNR